MSSLRNIGSGVKLGMIFGKREVISEPFKIENDKCFGVKVRCVCGKIGVLVLLLSGCQAIPHSNAPERAAASVAVAIAETTVGVTPWTGQLPLIIPSDTPFPLTPSGESSGAADAVSSEPEPLVIDEPEPCLDPIVWSHLYGPLATELKQSKKPFWLHFTTSNCAACEHLSRNVFVDAELSSLAMDKFHPYIIDGPRHADLLEAFDLEGTYPQDVYIWPDLTWIKYKNCPTTINGYVRQLESIQKPTKPKKTSGTYPIRNGWWSGCSSFRHLANASAHRGKFDTAWLKSLSWAELQSLHSDDHERRVKWNYVKRPST